VVRWRRDTPMDANGSLRSQNVEDVSTRCMARKEHGRNILVNSDLRLENVLVSLDIGAKSPGNLGPSDLSSPR
jgi:hypothetical protein